MLLGVLLVGKMATLLGKGDKVREDHTAEADMVERLNGVGLDVLGVVAVETLSNGVLDVAHRKHRLHLVRNLLDLHPPQLVEEVPHRHF